MARYLIQYHRIEHQVVLAGSLLVEFVNPRYFSLSCPGYGKKMEEVNYRWFKRTCGYENDRDVVAVMNLNRRGL